MGFIDEMMLVFRVMAEVGMAVGCAYALYRGCLVARDAWRKIVEHCRFGR